MQMKKTIRSLMLVHNFTPGPVGGAELQAERLAHGLACLGYDIHIMTNSIAHENFWHDFDGDIPYAPEEEIRLSSIEHDNSRAQTAIHIHRVPFLMAYQFVEGYIDTFRYLVEKRSSYDILHCHMAFGHAVVAVVVSKIFRKRCLIKFACAGDIGELGVIKSFPGYENAIHILHQADVVVAISREMEEELLNHGFSKHRIKYIPNGVDTKKFKPDGLKEQPGKIRFVLIGRRTPQKGVDLLLHAVDKLKHLGYESKFEVKLYGLDYPEYNYREMAYDLGVDVCVEFLPFEEDIVTIYKHAHVVLVPSRSEGLSNVLLEAMSMELPVVATSVSGTPDVVVDGIHGLLVPPESSEALAGAMIKLIDNPSTRESLGYNARQRVEASFSLEYVAQQYSDLYKSLYKPDQ